MNKRRASFERSRKSYKRLERDQLARYNRMSTDQDWTNVWPTSSMFKQSSVPLPVRQGFIKNLTENDGLPPEKYGNVELIKIPNFLHLTPPHIKKHCEVLKGS
jgi:small subunit ribosomal protein S35